MFGSSRSPSYAFCLLSPLFCQDSISKCTRGDPLTARTEIFVRSISTLIGTITTPVVRNTLATATREFSTLTLRSISAAYRNTKTSQLPDFHSFISFIHFRLLNGMTERKPIHVDKQYRGNRMTSANNSFCTSYV